jgi:hypothetical protein
VEIGPNQNVPKVVGLLSLYEQSSPLKNGSGATQAPSTGDVLPVISFSLDAA